MIKLLMTIHRVLGVALSLVFAVWFITGFVMIYHNFPRITDAERTRALPTIERPADARLDSLVRDLKGHELLKAVALRVGERGDWILESTSLSGERAYCHERQGASAQLPASEGRAYAQSFVSAPILRVDTLTELGRWIPYDYRFGADLPIYRYCYADDEATELYISSVSAEGVQLTTRSTRFWAWVGAIPHWLYIYNLRNYSDVWRSVVIGVSGIGAIMALSGLVVGIRMWWIGRKRRALSPYRKQVYRWHHILGYAFGLFVCTFAFSGMMSLQKVPRWLVPVDNEDLASALKTNPLSLHPSDFPLQYKEVLERYRGKVKRLQWLSFGEIPLYGLELTSGERLVLRADGSEIVPLELSREEVEARVKALYQEPVRLSIELIREQDNYYLHKRYTPALPAYKVVADDPDGSYYYIDIQTGDSRYFNRNARVRKWTYQALHSFSVKWLLERPVLWNVLMWTAMIAGTIISLTGVWLSVGYLSRKLRRKHK